MKCTECGYEMIDLASGSVDFTSKIVGAINVPNIPISTCRIAKCSKTFVSSDSFRRISQYVKKLESEAIDRLPIGEFISCLDAAELLGITKQALSKKIKLYRNLFMIKTIDGKDLIYKPSIDAYKSTGDGRVNISMASMNMYINSVHSLIHDFQRIEFSAGDERINLYQEEQTDEFAELY